jgi:hypothetical protein
MDTCTACVTCYRPLPAWDMPRLACDGCQQRTATQLAELPGLLAELPARIVPGPGSPRFGTLHRSAGPTEPIRLHVVTLIGNADAVLDSWARDWADVAGLRLDIAGRGVCGWLRWHLDWACRHHPAVDEAMREIAAVHRQVHAAVTGERGERPVRLRCPCGGIIPWRVSQDRYRCGGCATIYGREEAANLPAAPRTRAAA